MTVGLLGVASCVDGEIVSVPVDHDVVHAFVSAIHAAAATALKGVADPGVIQLVRIHPDDGSVLCHRFKISEVDHMVRQAVIDAGNGFNVYVEGRTLSKTASGRGSAAATRGVFAFVIDADADKGKGGKLGAEPSLIVETSPGNAHHWFLLERALTVEQAQPLGAAIRAKVGADADTGVITQPYRVAGTPNYPSKAKKARGRIPTATRLLLSDGQVWSAADLKATFPVQLRAQTTHGPRSVGLSGRTSNHVESLVAETGTDRSSRFHAAVGTAFRNGLTLDDLEALMRRNPEGCASKYLSPTDRLAREIERSWGKVEVKAEEVRWEGEGPPYKDRSISVEEARRAVETSVHRFIAAAEAYRVVGDDEAEPPVQALHVTTGVGKTFTTACAIANYVIDRRRACDPAKPILYAVPTHRLGNDIEAEFTEYGVSARVFRGREADDPARPGEQMCDDLPAVEIALSMGGSSISKMCCKKKLDNGTEAKCRFFDTCSYQSQVMTKPEVWIVAHQILFSTASALGKVEVVIIDEGFWQTGIRIPKRGLTLDEIGSPVLSKGARQDCVANDVEVYRAQFARALKRQGQPGGVHRANLIAEGLDVERCNAAIKAEWNLKDEVSMWPGMPLAERRIAARAAAKAQHSQAFIRLWNAARGLLDDPTIEVSGRLYIDIRDDKDGRVLVAKARSLRSIPKQWQRPTLILDATLPSLDILRAFYPQIETAPAIEAAMPHVRVRHVIDAPTSGKKLKPDSDGTANRNLRAIRREILKRFIELGRAPVLVVAQQVVSEWLRQSRLPFGISVEHFNAVAGLDQYRDVRGLIVVGRTLPPPNVIEALAGVITGKDIEKAVPWYPKPTQGVRLRDGKPMGLECERHPDPVAEACRWQICEGELLQALGRARGVNRTAADPLDIDIITNVVLPLIVDVVEPWKSPGEEIEMLIEGIVLNSPADMATAWRKVWATELTAKKWNHRFAAEQGSTGPDPYRENIYTGVWPRARRFRYQRSGVGQKWRTGGFDPAVVRDPRAWLECRLGQIADFLYLEAAPPAESTVVRQVDRGRHRGAIPQRTPATAPSQPGTE